MKKIVTAGFLSGIIGLGIIADASSPVFAADNISIHRPHSMTSNLGSNFYVGANLGYSKYQEIDDSAASYGLFGGYNVNEILAIDIGWTNLGEASDSDARADTSLFQLGMLGKVPVRTDLTLFGKVGLAMWDYDLSQPFSDSDSSTDAYIGFGADYSINGRSAVRFGLDFYSMNLDLSNGLSSFSDTENVSEFSIGILFKP